MRSLSKNEIEFVKESIINEIPKSRVIKILRTEGRIFKRMCEEVNINYPNFRKKKVNHNPFLDINNKDVQYWLGWLATDGYVSHDQTRVVLSLSIKDIDVVEKFRDFVSPKLTIHHVMHHGKFEMVFVSFRNKEITDFLKTLGFYDNKTFTFVPKFKISWDYIRGVFEGDGYLRWGSACEINIASACKEHMEIIYNFVRKFDINCKIINKTTPSKTPMYYFEVSRKDDIKKFIDYIYKDSDIFMNRKYTKARAIRNDSWKTLKFGEPESGIPSQA